MDKPQSEDKPVYSCRFHPTDGFHEVGCPHLKWAADELQLALDNAKRSQENILNLVASAKQQGIRETVDKIYKNTQTLDNPFYKSEYKPGDPMVQKSIGFSTALLRIQEYLYSLTPEQDGK